MKIFVLVSLLIQIILGLQTILLQNLNIADQESLVLANQLSNIIKQQKYINMKQFTCLTILPSNLTKNAKQRVQKLNLTLSYQHEEPKPTQTAEKYQGKDKQQIIGFYEDYDYDKILDLLHGSCAIHQTAQFLYQYCHKQKIRQFDSLLTKQRMVKQKFQDINLGYYNYQQAVYDSQETRDQGLRHGSKYSKIKYNQIGELKILDTLLQGLPRLPQEDKHMPKQQMSDNSQSSAGNTNSHSLNDQQRNAGRRRNSQDRRNIQNTKTVTQPKVVIQAVPMRSVPYNRDNLFTVDTVNHRQYELDKENRVVRLNYPLIRTNNYFLYVQYVYEVTCQFNLQGRKSLYLSKATLVSPFQLVFRGNVEKCHKITQVSNQPIQQKLHDGPFYVDRLRVVQDFLYGQIDEGCTNNWDWAMGKSRSQNILMTERQNYLQKGTTLLIGFTVNNSGTLVSTHHPVTIKQIIAPGVVKLHENINLLLISKKPLESGANNPAWISSCRMISKKPINLDSQNANSQIVTKDIIKIKELSTQNCKKPGDQMLCLCGFSKFVEQFLEMQVTLGRKLIEAGQSNQHYSYFQFYKKKTVKAYSSTNKGIQDMCQALICYDIVQESKKPREIQNVAKKSHEEFTKIVKLTAGNKYADQELCTQQQILIIDIFQKGMVKIHTYSQSKDEKSFYLASSSSLTKVTVFSNGTKQIIGQNSLYQNSTTSSFQSWLGSSILIHKNFMWRGLDKVVFPRMDFAGQRITSIQRVSGIAYVRKLNLSNMENKQKSHMVSRIRQLIQGKFRVKKYPLFIKEQQNNGIQSRQNSDDLGLEQDMQPSMLEDHGGIQKTATDFSKVDFSQSSYKPLNKSISLRYQYFHGQFCGQPINRNRRTDVLLQCGQPWLKIQQVKQTSPCVYELKVSTRLLCRSEYKKMVQKIERLNVNNKESRVKLQRSTVCYPKDSSDNVEFAYNVDTKEVLYQGY